MTKVVFSKKAAKQAKDLPERKRDILGALIKDITNYGPIRGNWPNYGKLSTGEHHCHLGGGRPTYVVKWVVVKKDLVRIVYVGTHEKAGY